MTFKQIALKIGPKAIISAVKHGPDDPEAYLECYQPSKRQIYEKLVNFNFLSRPINLLVMNPLDKVLGYPARRDSHTTLEDDWRVERRG